MKTLCSEPHQTLRRMNHASRKRDRLCCIRLVSRQDPEANPRRLQLPDGNEDVGGQIVLDGDGAFEMLVGFQLSLQRFGDRRRGVAGAEKRLLPVRVLRLGELLSGENERSIRLATAAIDEAADGRVLSLLRRQKRNDDRVRSLWKKGQPPIPCRRGRVADESGSPRSFASAPS